MSERSLRLREQNDRVLWPLIDAADDDAREAAAESILTSLVKPTIADVLSRYYTTGPALRAEDREELTSTVMLSMLRKLRATALFEEHAIAELENYVATLTYHALYDFRRDRSPERHRLKKSLRYVLSRDARFAVWETPNTAAAGLSSWRQERRVLTSAAIAPLDPTPEMQDRSNPGDALLAVFVQIGAPVTLDALVDLVAGLWNVRDVATESAEPPADERRDQLTAIEQRQYMERLWSEIRQLPPNQRAALLLNLRDSAGRNAAMLFLLLEIADVSEVAAAADVSEKELNELWEDLPLDDLTIAKRLHLTRQQVINLRQSARARLARRMSAWR